MVDAVNDHDVFGLLDLVDHAVCATAGGSQPFQLTLERSADAVGVLQERPDHECHDRSRSALRKSAELAIRRTRDAKLERLGFGHRFR
jgi:hypothetical protein